MGKPASQRKKKRDDESEEESIDFPEDSEHVSRKRADIEAMTEPACHLVDSISKVTPLQFWIHVLVIRSIHRTRQFLMCHISMSSPLK